MFGWRPLLECRAVTMPIQGTARVGHKVYFARGKIPSGGKSPRKCIHSVPVQEMGKDHAVWLASGERRSCSNEANTGNLLKFAGVPKTRQPISAACGPKFAILWGHLEEILVLNKFFPTVDTCLALRYSWTKSYNGAKMVIFCIVFASSTEMVQVTLLRRTPASSA